MKRSNVSGVVAQLTRALGSPVATPPHPPGRYREWRWPCPVCFAGHDDPGIQLGHVLIRWAPLFLTSDGRLGCSACYCSAEDIAHEVQIRLAELAILERLGLGRAA